MGFAVQTLVSNSVVKYPLTLFHSLVFGDERLLQSQPILVSGPYCSCALSRGRFDPAYPEGLGPFRQLGFVCRGRTISLRDFLEGYHHSIFVCRLGRRGAIGDVL